MMQQAMEISKALGGMPIGALSVVVILGAFALAGYAIFAVTNVMKGKKNGD